MVDSFDATQLPQLELRPTTSDDEEFARRLFVCVHASELDLPPALLEQQYQAWRHNLAQYPQLRDEIIVLREQPIGRLVVAAADTHLLCVDLMIDPEFWGRGVGTQILRRLQVEATAQNLPIELRVQRTNRAQSLYARLGFEVTDADPTHLVMRWESSLPQ